MSKLKKKFRIAYFKGLKSKDDLVQYAEKNVVKDHWLEYPAVQRLLHDKMVAFVEKETSEQTNETEEVDQAETNSTTTQREVHTSMEASSDEQSKVKSTRSNLEERSSELIDIENADGEKAKKKRKHIHEPTDEEKENLPTLEKKKVIKPVRTQNEFNDALSRNYQVSGKRRRK
ncbi:unnamed protein product [Didymodactylos carnosus]|uniref:Uncharacterized protein n=1 Tax=Didymodactylos carnosus TaxID=1234261 RepID=A0A815IND1_9BILA|nr:unnamed protein product [Didymodactylos carnosus]CAF4251263.1 unnamed protein product [Didymodactylos carnosus]